MTASLSQGLSTQFNFTLCMKKMVGWCRWFETGCTHLDQTRSHKSREMIIIISLVWTTTCLVMLYLFDQSLHFWISWSIIDFDGSDCFPLKILAAHLHTSSASITGAPSTSAIDAWGKLTGKVHLYRFQDTVSLERSEKFRIVNQYLMSFFFFLFINILNVEIISNKF